MVQQAWQGETGRIYHLGASRGVWALVLSCLAAAGGCWREVAYDPATRPPRQSLNNSGDEDSPTLADEADSTAANDIDGQDEDGTPPTDSTTVDAAPVSPATTAESAAAPMSEAPPSPAVTDSERLAAWTLASKWSLAAAYAGRGRPTVEYAGLLDQASAAAQELGIVLPELPAPPRAEQLAPDMAAALRGAAGAELGSAIGARLDAATAGAARLAITAHVLLLVYTPLEADAPTLARELREAGTASKLPPELWQPLVDLVSRRSEYEPVKRAVLALPKSVEKHYAAAAGGRL